MTEERFWTIIEIDDECDDVFEEIKSRLVCLSEAEIIEFGRIFTELYWSAYRWDLWGTAYLINGGCSDDGFMDFRFGLISLGQEIFDKALENPDSLADLDLEEIFIPFEELGGLADQAFHEKTGKDMPSININRPKEPMGEPWDFDDMNECTRRLPRLTKATKDHS